MDAFVKQIDAIILFVYPRFGNIYLRDQKYLTEIINA